MKEIVEPLQKKAKKYNATIGCVESFTGGLFANEMTDIPGASKVFKGGFITYTNEEKVRLLGLTYDFIDEFGVVSEECAREMARRGRSLLNVDYCVSFTGNAGPEALEGKPVGLIYIGISTYSKTNVYKYQLEGSRQEIKQKALIISLDLLSEMLGKIKI